MRLLVSLVLGVLVTALVAPGVLSAQSLETVIYLGRSGADQVERVRRHADLISVLAPQAFRVRADGRVRGRVSPELLRVAREEDIAVVPLIHNPGFDQESVHGLLDDPEARRRTIRTLVQLAVEHGFRGWQFDFENIHRSYRDRYTRFYRETAEAFGDSLELSVAVVPGTDAPGRTPFQRYMKDNWRGSFDLPALAGIGDFVSFMTYAQHGGVTTPGPIAALPWMRRMMEHALDAGLPPEKLSLGLPWYSGYWFPDFRDGTARVRGREVGWERVSELLERSGARLRWLPREGVSFAFWPEAGVFHWLFVEDRRAFETKLGLLDEYPGLRGVSIWVLGSEDPGVWRALEERGAGR